MTKITLNNVADLTQPTTAAIVINANSDTIETAFDNTLSRNGQAPNSMGASIDMDSNRILNLPSPLTANEPVRLTDLSTFSGGGTIASIPSGGVTGQVLAKSGSADYVIGWVNDSTLVSAGTNLQSSGTNPVTLSTISSPTFSGTVTAGSFVGSIAAGTTLVNPIISGATPAVNGAIGFTAGLLNWFDGSNIRSAVASDTTQTLTGKTYDTAGAGNSFLINGVAVTANTGTGAVVRATSPTLVTPVLGAATGTSLNLTGLTISSAVATDGSKNLVSVTNTGTGNNVLATSPTLVTPVLGIPSSGTLTSCTGLPILTGLTGAGTGVLTALGVNVGTAGAFVVNGGALGSPSSAGTIPAFTLGGTVAGGGNQINNAIIGTTTPLAGFFTTLSATTSLTTPIHASAAGIQFQTNGSTVAGNITTGQQFIFGNNTSLATGSPVVEITRNTGTLPQVASYTPILQVSNADATQTSFVMQGFNSASGGQPLIVYAKARGTAASPTSIQSGDTLGGNFAYGYTTVTTPGWVTSAGTGFNFVATDNYTPTVCGARTDIYGTPTGSAAVAIAASFGAGVMVGNSGAVDPGLGAILATTSIKSNGATSGIGYATGAGGAVTQLTNRTTGVTLNTITGAITLFSQVNTAVSGATAQSFTVTNSAVAATDVVIMSQKSGTDLYQIFVTNVAAGSFKVTNYSTGGTTNEAPVFNFAIIKGVTS